MIALGIVVIVAHGAAIVWAMREAARPGVSHFRTEEDPL